MNNKKLQKLLKKNKSNAGFTLTELLVGLFMSIFVIGALGFGLMTVLQNTQSEGSKTAARNETGRALDFISDELRRAEAIEVDMSPGNLLAVAPSSIAKAPTGGEVRLALQIPGVDERVIYYVAPPQNNSPWKGPLVFYRWGPNLNADGDYTDPSDVTNWSSEALIDKIDDTPQSIDCDGTGSATNTITYKGFYACVVDDDGDQDVAGNPIFGNENARDITGDGVINIDDQETTDTNGDGVINNDKNGDGVFNNQDGADTDGKSITAQLFFTGETITVSGQPTDNYSADTQAVARARETLENKIDDNTSVSWNVEGLGGALNCEGKTISDMKTDFSNDPDPQKTVSWIQNSSGGSQAQPIEINPNSPLNITSTAQGCPSKAGASLSHEIDFNDPETFNGDHETDPLKNSSDVKEKDGVSDHERVHFFKQGFNIPTKYKGYDANKNGVYEPNEGDQRSLGRFLFEKGLAIPDGDPDLSDTTFKLPTPSELQSYLNASNLSAAEKLRFKALGDNQRIIAFEVGQLYPDKNNDGIDSTGGKNPGFDLQDNIFIVTSDVFKKKFDSNCFGGNGCP
jgi:type II secretory pathway pseudopilin PulG